MINLLSKFHKKVHSIATNHMRVVHGANGTRVPTALSRLTMVGEDFVVASLS